VQVGIFHLFRLFDLVQFDLAVAPFHKINADRVVDRNVLCILAVPVFVELLADADVLVFMFKSDVVGKEPEFGAADVVIVDLDTGYFYGG